MSLLQCGTSQPNLYFSRTTLTCGNCQVLNSMYVGSHKCLLIPSMSLQYWNSWRWQWEWGLCWTLSCKRCLRYCSNSTKENSTDASSSLSSLVFYHIPLKLLLNLLSRGISFLGYIYCSVPAAVFPWAFLPSLPALICIPSSPLKTRAFNLLQLDVSSERWWVDSKLCSSW